MLACDKTITLIQQTYNSETDTEEYTSTVIRNCSWYSKVKIELQDKGVRSGDIVTVRIPEEELPEGIVLANGDYIVKDALGDKNITKHSDLKGLEYATVVSIGDNRRGMLRHWVLVGKR